MIEALVTVFALLLALLTFMGLAKLFERITKAKQ